MDTDRRLPYPGRSAAVLVGVTDYTPHWSPAALPQIGRGVDSLRDALVAGGGFGPERIRTLVDDAATHDAVVDAVREACASSDDTVLFYFGGHGVVSGRRLLLALTGADPQDTHLRMMPVNTICRVIGARMPARLVVVLDCCHAGLASTDLSDLASRAPASVGVALLAAVPATGRAIAAGDPAGHTLFTGALVDALRTGRSKERELLTLQWLADDVLARCQRVAGRAKLPLALPDSTFYGHGRTSLLALAANPAARPAGVIVDLRDHDAARGAAAVHAVGDLVVRLPDAEGPVVDLVARYVADGVEQFTFVHPSDWGAGAAGSVEAQVRGGLGGRELEVTQVPRAVALVVEARARGNLTVKDGDRLLVVEESSGEASATVVEVGRSWSVRGAPATALAGLPAEIAADRRARLLDRARADAGRSVRVLLVADDADVVWPVAPKVLAGRVLLDDSFVVHGAHLRVGANQITQTLTDQGPQVTAERRPWWRTVPWTVAALGGGLGGGGFLALTGLLGVSSGVAALVSVAAAAATVAVGREVPPGGASSARL